VWLQGAAFPETDAFETPLGEITLDKELIEKMLEEFSWISVSDEAHSEEHCLEVQLPFLQETLGDFELLPLVVGETKTEHITEIIQQFSEDTETLIVISTDLSHFHDYQTAREIDERTANAIELLEQNRISTEDACGAYPLRGALLAASQNHWNVHRLGLCNSGDTAGDRARVVGYGAWAMTA
jgi:AmmeMemoRadiSam system protein B